MCHEHKGVLRSHTVWDCRYISCGSWVLYQETLILFSHGEGHMAAHSPWATFSCILYPFDIFIFKGIRTIIFIWWLRYQDWIINGAESVHDNNLRGANLSVWSQLSESSKGNLLGTQGQTSSFTFQISYMPCKCFPIC